MSKELNELRSQGLKPGTTNTDDSGSSPDIAGNSSFTIPPHDFNLSVDTVQIGGVVINAETAVEAFKTFATLFHHRLPVLLSINITTIYHSSQLLFWTIISIVSSHTLSPASQELFNQIAAPFLDMVRNEALQAPLPLQRIQALLLLCMWPMPVDSQPKDPSWLYSGITVNSALYLGLHRAGPSSRDKSCPPESTVERVMAWLGCFYVSGSLSMNFGFRPMLDSSSELSRINACLQTYPIPREFASEIKLQGVIADFDNVLSHTANDGASDSSILHLLDRELDSLRSLYPDQWPRMLEYNTLVAKLHMYSVVISRDGMGNTARDILLKLSFSTALRIISLANMRNEDDLRESHGVRELRQYGVLPKAYYRGLGFTTAFLLRYFSLNTTASAEEQQLAANHVALSHAIFKSCSTYANDEFGRVAAIFEELCQRGPMPMDPRRVAPGDRTRVLIKTMRLAAAESGNPTKPNAEPPIPPTGQSFPLDPNPNPVMNETLDPWAVDMIFSDQYWNDSTWDILNLPFMETQFPPRQNG
ncbi:hypothetical protein F5X98DRAFT_68100 [Xylaria grammica]|nr:hypothetical protein F5X98DRAFT_68100 [Xylaria grammica]